MKILLAHNRYQQAGGEDTVVENEALMLLRRGHRVQRVIVNNDNIVTFRSRLSSAFNSFYSISAYRTISQLIQKFKPDIFHVHNFVPNLSPSVFFAANSLSVPTVLTLHNYRMLCANGKLFREGAPCEECITQGTFLPGVKHACYRDSRLGSAVIGASTAIHGVLGTWENRVGRYIALTTFAEEKLGKAKLNRRLIRIKPNFVIDRGMGSGGGGMAHFVGRLSEEKGIDVLIQADLEGKLALPVHVTGDGPLRSRVIEASMKAGSQLVYLGSKTSDELADLMKGADALVVPSIWYEGFPMVIVEALSCGLPVLASRIGGLPEVVEENISGMLFEAGSATSLLQVFNLYEQKLKSASMRQAARDRYLQYYSEEANYRCLIAIYEELGSQQQ